MSRPKYRPGSQHPEQYREDLNPDALGGENLGRPLEVINASDLKEVADAWPRFTDAELREIPIVKPGERLEQGATYVDLRRAQPREFTATGSMEADERHWYVPKAQVHYQLWNRILGTEEPERR